MSKLPTKAEVSQWWTDAGCTKPLSQKGYNYYKKKSKEAVQKKAKWLLGHDSPKCVAHFADAPTGGMRSMNPQAPMRMPSAMVQNTMHQWARSFDEQCVLECYGYCPRPNQCVVECYGRC